MFNTTNVVPSTLASPAIHTMRLPALIGPPVWLAWRGSPDMIPARYGEGATREEAVRKLEEVCNEQ